MHIPVYSGNQLLAALFSGVFVGAGMAIFYMRGSSSGGADLLTMTIKVTKPYLSIGFVTMAIDFVIICLGWPVFGSIDAVSLRRRFDGGDFIVLDRILNGASMGKLIFYHYRKGRRDCQARSTPSPNEGRRGSRPGAATPGTEKEVILCACANAEAHKIRTASFRLDPNAFIIVSQTNEIRRGFYLSDQTTAFL